MFRYFTFKMSSICIIFSLIQDHLFAILEYCELGDLRSFLRKQRPMNENDIVGISREDHLSIYLQLASGMHFLASKNVRVEIWFFTEEKIFYYLWVRSLFVFEFWIHIKIATYIDYNFFFSWFYQIFFLDNSPRPCGKEYFSLWWYFYKNCWLWSCAFHGRWLLLPPTFRCTCQNLIIYHSRKSILFKINLI